ncbi:MAG: hypothetical protein HC828_21045 [Blastochloris sp.]|nr:hypothetical protein [Blastochloris sp.]
MAKPGITIRPEEELLKQLQDFATREKRSMSAQILYMLEIAVKDWGLLQKRELERQQNAPSKTNDDILRAPSFVPVA